MPAASLGCALPPIRSWAFGRAKGISRQEMPGVALLRIRALSGTGLHSQIFPSTSQV
jgi:hypothetical protein